MKIGFSWWELVGEFDKAMVASFEKAQVIYFSNKWTHSINICFDFSEVKSITC
jgi:hypothetical protein